MKNRLVDRTAHRIAALMLTLSLMTLQAQAQHPRTVFDFYSPLGFSYRLSHLARGDMNGDGTPDLVSAGAARLTVSVQGNTSFEWKQHNLRTDLTPVMIATGRINADGRDDIAVYSSRPPAVSIYASGPTGAPRYLSSVELSQEFQRLMLADIDGDRYTDIILFGKKTLGITVLPGNGRGQFGEERVLFPEQSVSLLSVLPLDDDDIPDLVAVNWIRNRVEIYSGFGGSNFSDPAILRFDEEPLALSVGDLNGDRVRDLLVGFGETPAYRILAGDPSGVFTVSFSGALPGPPVNLRIGDANGDGRNDIMVATPSAGVVGVGFQDGYGVMSQIQNYFVGMGAKDAVFFRDRRNRYLNCAVIYDGGREIRLMHTRTPDGTDLYGYTLATGRDPSDLLLADVNGDGWTDAVVAQGIGPAMNIFLNNRHGTFFGLFSLALREPAHLLLPLNGDSARSVIVGAGDGPGPIHCTFVRLKDYSFDEVSIPGNIPGYVVAAEKHTGSDSKRIYVLREEGAPESGSVFAYDVSGAKPYEETELTPALRGGVIASLVHDFDRDGRLDLVTLSGPDSAGDSMIRYFRQDSLHYTLRCSTPFPTTEKPAGRCILWSQDLNGDGDDDLLINFTKPSNAIFVAMARGDTSFMPPRPALRDVRVEDRGHLLIATDFDSDGKTDLVLLNERTNTIQFFPGDGRGNFDRPVNLSSGKGVTALGVADLNKDGEMELVVSAGEEGGLSVTSFHHPLYKRSLRNGSD